MRSTADMQSTPLRIRLQGVGKVFPTREGPVTVLQDVDFQVADGQFVSIIGPSGCGKTTLLNIIAGLEQPTVGVIELDGQPAIQRLGMVGYMQQKDLLMPWRTVLDNVILALEVRGVSRSKARERAQELVGLFGLEGFEKLYPAALSGGMRQRAAFLRTVLTDKDVLLLDEPFGALDALTRTQKQEWLLEMWGSLGKTIVLITHDVDEAILLSDTIYVLSSRPGQVRQVMDVGLPRPRSYQSITEAGFIQLKVELLAGLREESLPTGAALWR